MYTNELLEEKYKARRQISKGAEIEETDYFEIINKEAQDRCEQNGWNIQFDR